MKFRLGMEVVIYNVAMYLVGVIGYLTTIVLYVFAGYTREAAYDWIPWVASSTVYAIDLLHYLLHRTSYYLAMVDVQSKKYDEAIGHKGNNSGFVGFLNVMVLLPIVGVVALSVWHGSDGNTLGGIIRIAGSLAFLLSIYLFALSRTAGRSTWGKGKK